MPRPDRPRPGAPQSANASHSRSTSGSPNICCAWPAVGYAAITQLTVRAFCDFELRFERLDRTRHADATLVEVGEQLRLGITGEHDQRVAVERRRARELPGVRVGQVLFRRMLDERAANVRVAVQDVDEPGAGAIPRFRELAREWGMVEQRGDEQRLPGWTLVPTRTIRSA